MPEDIREIVMDTETTGLEPREGHRIVEIGALELLNHVPTGRVFHEYINPRRSMPAEAFAIHGISDEKLVGMPYFEQLSDRFLEFIGDATLVIHNAPFDVKFLNAEFEKAGAPPLSMDRVVDTLQVARTRFPGAQNSLDGLSRRFGIDTSRRVKHGALLDSEMLAEVYLELKGGRQSALVLAAKEPVEDKVEIREPIIARKRPGTRPSLLSDEEKARHDAFVETLGEGALWKSV